MKKVLFLALLLLCFINFCHGTDSICFEDYPLKASDNEILTAVIEKLKHKQKFTSSCLDLLIKRGFYKAASHLYDSYFLFNQIIVKNDLESTLSNNKRDLDQLYNSIMSSDTKTQVIEPIFQWAQSYKYIYIQVKFAHRLDAPGCLSVENEIVNFTNNTLFLTAFGIQAHQPITFTLNLTLFDEIVPENSTWSLEAVGTMFFNLTKSNDTLWRRLIIQKEKKIPIWWHMGSEQSVEMREFARMLDDEDEERERLEDKKRSKKRKDKKNEKKVEEPIITHTSSEQTPPLPTPGPVSENQENIPKEEVKVEL